MPGFLRDAKLYGDRLVYRAVANTWSGHHAAYCGCGQDWVSAHAIPAGMSVLHEGAGVVVLVGPGLTEGVDERFLTANALWKAVTGTPGTQDWTEPATVVDRSPAAEARRQAVTDAANARQCAERAAAKLVPASAAQRRYLADLAASVGPDRFAAAFDKAVARHDIEPMGPDETPEQAAARLTNPVARKLIATLVG